jgi:fibrillarin-like pre-rRNA processing protein
MKSTGNLLPRNVPARSRAGEQNVAIDVEPHSKFQEIYWITSHGGGKRLATKNLVPGKTVYGERLIKDKSEEYRVWDPSRSKLAAAILKGLETVPIRSDHQVLYLGAASGTTASHVSDIVGERGHVYCIEFAARSIRELVDNVCEFRHNMSPILADARIPEQYSTLVGKVDEIYCDIAQPEQAKVLADNADLFLRPDGWIMLAVKAQSIDVTKEPAELYKREVATLKERRSRISEDVLLEPYDKAHAMVVAQRLERK